MNPRQRIPTTRRRRALATTLALALVGASACGSVVPPEIERRMQAQRDAEAAHLRAVRELLVLDTTRGRMVFRLFPDSAPATVRQVRDWTEAGIYDGTWFHRVVREPRPFVIQGGDVDSAALLPATDPDAREAQAVDLGFGTTDPALPPEPTTRKHTPGALALAVTQDHLRAGPQFVISLARLPHLDGQAPVFGQLVGGWSVLQHLAVGDRIERATLLPPEALPGDWMTDIPPPDGR